MTDDGRYVSGAGKVTGATATSVGADELWFDHTCANRVSTDGQRRVYGRPNIGIWLIGCLQFAALAALGAIGTTDDDGFIRVAALIALVVDGILIYRIARTSLIVDGDHLIDRSLFRTRKFAAQDIDSFGPPGRRGHLPTNGIRVRLNSGRVKSTGVFGNDYVPRQLYELSAWLELAEQGGLRPTPSEPVQYPPEIGELPTGVMKAWRVLLIVVCSVLIFVVFAMGLTLLIDPSLN